MSLPRRICLWLLLTTYGAITLLGHGLHVLSGCRRAALAHSAASTCQQCQLHDDSLSACQKRRLAKSPPQKLPQDQLQATYASRANGCLACLYFSQAQAAESSPESHNPPAPIYCWTAITQQRVIPSHLRLPEARGPPHSA